jgi:TetR/AcrR family transcriptional regulator, regulator of cefoperazone and chloramphenicol sensitivity
MADPRPEATRERLLAAAAELFAERGFRGATMRAIAARARTNLAAANYHFGSKQKLYREVAFALFAALEERLERAGLRPDDATLARLPRPALEELLRSRIRAILETLLGDPGLHGTLMLREFCDPTPALREIARRFFAPMRREMELLVRALAPGLSQADAERCVNAIAGQVFFYRTHRPALLFLDGQRAYPARFAETMARHILEFSLGGIERLAGRAEEARCDAGS